MIKELYKLKKEFRSVKAPVQLRANGERWLLSQIEPDKRLTGILWLRRFGLGLAGLVLVGIFLFGFYDRTLAAIPGTPLYPVKIFAEEVVKKITGNSTPIVKDRASEIINLVNTPNKNSESNRNLKIVVKQYKEGVIEVKDNNKKSGQDSSNFQKILDDQHKQFTEVVKSNPEVEKDIEDALKVSGKGDNFLGD